MKKNIILFFSFLLAIFSLRSMQEVSPIETKEIVETKKKNKRVARYFVKTAANRTLLHNFCIFHKKLNRQMQELVCNGSVAKQSPFIMFLMTPQDIFTHLTGVVFPQYEKIKAVQLSTSQFSSYRNGYAEHNHHVTIGVAATLVPASKSDTIVTTDEFKHQLADLPITDALSVISRYLNNRDITIRDVVEETSDCKSPCNYDYYHDDDDMSKKYFFNLKDFLVISPEQETLLRAIAEGHTNGRLNRDKLYKITEADKKLLLPIKKFINNNLLFKTSNISFEYQAPTWYEKIKDKVLLAAPLLIVSSVIPRYIHNTINGKLQGCAGAAGVFASSFALGQWAYPISDLWNSGAVKVAHNFGSDNKTKIKRGWAFAALSLMHYTLTALAHKCLSYSAIPLQVIGYSLHGIRAGAYMCGLFNVRSYFRNDSLFADIFYFQDYSNPLSRRNRDDKSYTLGDLMNAPENALK